MAEVLTQSQIDALFNALTQGVPEEAAAEPEPDNQFRKYDFYSPKKFTKDKIKILNNIHENYARLLSSRLNAVLRANCELEVVNVEEQRYYEFSNSLNDNDVLTLVTVNLPDNTETAPILMYVSTQLMLIMIDRIIGGDGGDAETVNSSYTYTDLELSLYKNIVTYIIDSMKDGWANYLEIDFSLQRIERNPGMLQIIGMDETIVIVVLDVSIKDVNGQINICIPGSLLSSTFAAHDKLNAVKNKGNIHDNKEQVIMNTIKSSFLEVKVKLGDAQILLSDLYSMHKGDIINLNKPKDSEVLLYIGENPWFRGRLGVHNKNVAVKISGICENK